MRSEYESINLGDRIETVGHVIGKVIEVWRYHDGSESDYVIVPDRDENKPYGTVSININSKNYLRLISRYSLKQEKQNETT